MRALRPGCTLAVLAVVVAGCYREARRAEPVAAAPVEQAEPEPVGPAPIAIDVGEVEAVETTRPAEAVRPAAVERRLAFLVTGYGVEPKSGGPVERKAAALEAAVVDAIGRAVREMQRDPKRDRTPVEYKVTLAPGLNVFGQLVGGLPRTVVLLDRRGRVTELCARNGLLAHPPHDSKVVQQIFAATEGRLVLHGTRPADKPGRYAAEVGCYRKVERGSATRPAAGGAQPPVIATGR